MAGARTSSGGAGRPLPAAAERGGSVRAISLVGRREAAMQGMMDGMAGMMWGMGLVWLLILILLALGIAALVKYLLGGKR